MRNQERIQNMKKYLPLTLVILFPYMIIFAIVCIFTGFLMETVFGYNVFVLIAALLILYIAAFICSAVVFIRSLVKKRSAIELLRMNMIIKLVHIPAYVLIFLLGFAFFMTIFTFAFTIALMILDVMTIVLTGLLGLSGVIRGYSENKLSQNAAIVHGILQFVFCLDVASAIIAYRKAKKAPSENPQTEMMAYAGAGAEVGAEAQRQEGSQM